MPFVSKKQEKWAFATKQPWAKKWAGMTNQKTLKKKLKMKVDNSLGDSYGEMNPDTNEIKINVKAHHKKGKLDTAELASTIKHEMMHVAKPHATEKEVYKATAKTKISPQEQMALISKLRHKRSKPGDMYNAFQKKKIKRKINTSQPSKAPIAIAGLV